MKTKLLLSIVFFALFASFAASAQIPIRKGWWKFDDAADLLKANLGSPLVLTGTQTSVPGPQVDNLATQVPLGSFLTMTPGLPASLGGTLANEYTLQFDFSVPTDGIWHAFYQTDATNGSDAELFTKPANTIGVGGPGYSTLTIAKDTWYRMVVSVKNGVGGFYKVYIDGTLWLDAPAQAIDDRWALANSLLIFGDNDGDDGPINCSELGLWDIALTDAQALELGDATPTPTRLGWWKFDDATDATTLLKAEIGAPLVLTGTQTSVPGPSTGNLATEVPLGSYLSMTHGIAANGGGTSVNEYSLQIDFSAPTDGIWHAFFQTDATNASDAELFTRPANTIGVGGPGYSTNTISANRWYRMIVSVKNGDGGFFKVYVDGELWLDAAGQLLDDRMALANQVLLFGDNDGDDGIIHCSEVAIWDVALSALQASELGKAANNVLVTGITVTAAGNATTIETVGGTLQMSAAILPANATKPEVVWSLTNGTDKAAIDANGLLTALKNGVVTVYATSTDGSNIVGSLDITISNQPVISVTSITVTSAGNVTTIDLKGGTLQMSAAVLPAEASDLTVTWSVSNANATITADGLLTAVADGIVTAKATANDGSNVFGSIDITLSNQNSVRARKGWWKFDDAADMLKPEIGSPLTLSGVQTSVGGPATGNLATEVPLDSYFEMSHGIAANGGGALVNEWTLQIDFSVAMLDTWYAFFQTLDGDADLFVAATPAGDIGRVPNAIGSGSVRYTANTILPETWYRMLVSVKNGEGGFFKIYMDGVLWLDAEAQPIDGRYALGAILQIFQDDDGDDGTIKCSELGIWDVALTAAEALDLDKATNSTVGILNLQASRNSDLGQNFPNPFSTSTTFPYQIKESGNVTFRIIDLTGKEIEVINQGNKTPGDYQLVLQTEKLNNGIYYFQMTTNNKVSTKKMVVFK